MNQINLTRVIKTTISAEGKEINSVGLHIPYQDHLGVWTIGFGQTHWLGVKVRKNTRPITDQQAKTMLHASIVEAFFDAKKFIRAFDELNSVRQEALTEMAFQLGGWKQRKFKKARAAGNARDFEIMADELIDSLWYVQTPKRCLRVSQMVRTGTV